MDSPALVSILIPCYNAEAWVGEAIRSALAQTYPRKEVVVVDDGSTDGSLEVVRSFGEQIRWESGPNRGGDYARNRLLALARGQWLQYLDADDFLLPDKVAGQMEALAAHPEVDILFGPSIMQFHEGEATRRELLPIPEPHDPWALLATWKLPQTGSPLWRRQTVEAAGGWKLGQKVCQEHELYLRLLKAGARFRYDDAGGSVYRQWSQGTVCRVNVPNTYRARLAIMQEAERFLLETQDMTPERRSAFDRAYLACSRIIWTFDPRWAREIMRNVDAAHGGSYTPDPAQAPKLYGWLYKRFGFEAAERAAAFRRRIMPTT